MQREQTGTEYVKVGALGLAGEQLRRRLGVYRFPGDEVMAIFPTDLDHSWRRWEPACELLRVPDFPHHVVLAATHRRTALYVIAHVDEPRVREALRHLSSNSGGSGILLLTPTQTEYLTLAHGVDKALGELLRDTVQPVPTRAVTSLVPPAALVAQLPEAFKTVCREASRCNKRLTMYLYGDHVLYQEAVEVVVGSPAPAM